MSLPKRMPRLSDTIRTQMLIGRIRLSYEPPRSYKDVYLDDHPDDVTEGMKKFSKADVRLCTSYNILEDWRIIDIEVMDSDMKESEAILKRIKEK